MPRNEIELLERDAKRNIGEELLKRFEMLKRDVMARHMPLSLMKLLPSGSNAAYLRASLQKHCTFHLAH